MPASCQARPYSPPPRRLATASRPPVSSQAASSTENDGVIGMSNPPYPYSSAGTSPLGRRSERLVRKTGTCAPSSEVTNTCSVTYPLGSIRAVDGLTCVAVPSETRYDHSDPDSVKDVSPKCMTSLSGRPESPGPLPQASPIEA